MYILEYVWLDSESNFRSKTRVSEKIETWNFDGSSTGQAFAKNSDLLLKPVFTCKNPFKNKDTCLIVLCDVWIDEHTPHPSNSRIKSLQIFERYTNEKPLFGLEQEFYLQLPDNDTNYYCKYNFNTGRECAEEIFDKCLEADLKVTGMNAEVSRYQWEIQVCEYGVTASDHLMVMRYIMERVASKYNYSIILHPKPVSEYSGSGCHVNFSTESIRNNQCCGGVGDIMKRFEKNHRDHLNVYGLKNELRLTGFHETCNMNEFRWGKSDRTASIRCNSGYFEDRRPGANIDPYTVTSKILDTLLYM